MAAQTKAEAQLAAKVGEYVHDPLGHALFAYPWGEAGSPLERAPGPRQWQADTLGIIASHLSHPGTRFTPLRIAVASGHGPGKSGLIAMIVKWALDTCVDTRIVLTAVTEGQLLTKTMPELQKWHNLSLTKSWFKPTATALISNAEGHDRAWRLDAITWSASNTEAFAGLHNQGRRIVVIYDEAAGIDDRVWEVTEGALTDTETEVIWIAFGNPTKNTGRFRQCFGKHRHLWHTRQIDSRTVEGTNRAYLEEIVQTYGLDSDITKVRVLGQFPSASSLQFISSTVVAEARSRVIDLGAIMPSEPVIFGIDHARFGDDRSVLAIRQGRDARSRPWTRWQGANSMQIAGDVAQEANRYHPDAIFVDAGGPNAGGVIDRLGQLLGGRYPIFEINFGGAARVADWNDEVRVKVQNKRVEMWTNMRAWLARGAIPDEQSIADDLIGPEYSYAADSSIILEKKDHMKKRGLASPDDGDALALTFAEHVEPREVPGYLNPENYERARPWDRYAELSEYQPPSYGLERPFDRYQDLDYSRD